MSCISKNAMVNYNYQDLLMQIGQSEDRKSTSGYCYSLCEQGPVISWKKKQPTVVLSTCEAEYVTMTPAIQEGQFLI